MRDILVHDYDEVEIEEIWTVITENLPPLPSELESLAPPKQ